MNVTQKLSQQQSAVTVRCRQPVHLHSITCKIVPKCFNNIHKNECLVMKIHKTLVIM